MNESLPALLLQGSQPGAFDPSFLLLMAGVFVIFYFLTIRPQSKRQRQHEAMLKSLGRGDRVVLRGGIHGTITAAGDEVLTLEIAQLRTERIRVKSDRSGVERLIERAAPPGGNS